MRNAAGSTAKLTIFFLLCCFYAGNAFGQQTVAIRDSVDQHIFSYKEIEYLVDRTGELTFNQVTRDPIVKQFKPSPTSTPQTDNLHSTYWYRIRIGHDQSTKEDFLLEFFDQTIDRISVFVPDSDGTYVERKLGDEQVFASRFLSHKNFQLPIDHDHKGTGTYYIKVRSSQTADVIIVLRSVRWFIHYSLDEYFSFGIFYGMIVVFSFYNLLMFLAMKQRQYLDYVFYVLSVGLYQMCADGIAYQYLWPGSPKWNQGAYGIALYLVSVSSLLFARDLLYVKSKAPFLYKLINFTIILRTVIFAASLLINREWFSYKFFELIPLMISFLTGVYIYRQGYRPARFYVLGNGILFFGFILKLLIVLTNGWLNFGVLSYYSLSICFILEMILLSFAAGDKVLMLRIQKEQAQRQTIEQMKENEHLKDILNKDLEEQVSHRTREVTEKSEIIQSQYEQLRAANALLTRQAEEISRMNVLLAKDNVELKTNIEKVTRARVMSADVNFEEFSRIYPDAETCYQFLAELKWNQGYSCVKCSHDHYYPGHAPLSRRCSKCHYEESVTANTILQNSRISVNKAFYMIYLIYSTKGKISSHKLSDILGIRQSTCWAYSSKLKKMMEARKKELKNAGEQGWSKLVLE